MYADNPKSYGNLHSSFTYLRKHPAARDAFVRGLVAMEPGLQAGSDQNVREVVTGPLVDAAFEPGTPLKIEIEGGLVYEFQYSSKIARDFVMSREAKPDHVWEPQTTKTLLALSKGKKAVVIGGAYFGDHAVMMALGMAKDGLCHCFELSGTNISYLNKNAAANGVSNIRVHQRALWSKSGISIELAGLDSHASPREAEATAANSFQSQCIDDFCAENGLGTLDLIMLDIEGGEHAALQGAHRILSGPSAPAVVFEVHRAYVDWTDGLANTPVVKGLTDCGYEVFAIRDYQGNENMRGMPVELVELEGLYLEGPPHGFNMLAVKDRASLDSKVFRIVRGVSPKLLFHRDPKIHAPLP